jgi:acyl-CoA synthetase (AMP-forming)/AMP-acid ligase II
MSRHFRAAANAIWASRRFKNCIQIISEKHTRARRGHDVKKLLGRVVMPEVKSLADIRTVADITRLHAKTRPDRVAIHFERQRTTFAELDHRANRVANGLIAEGVQPRSRIAILSKNTPAFFDLWFGTAKADAVLVPINFRLAPQEVAYIVEDAGAQLLFVGADFYPLVEKVKHDLKTVRRIIALDGAHGSWTTYADWLAGQSERDPGLPIAPEHCSIQMYTSGTTGNPKGAQLGHANLLTLLPGALNQFGAWRDNDVNLVCMPLFHIGGSAWALIGFYCGVPTVLMRDPDPAAILRLIPEYRITKAFMVPALLLFLMQNPQCKTTDFSSLELIVYGASPAPVDLVRNALQVFGCGLAQVYGLTETTGAITYLPPEDHDEKNATRLKSCGKAMTGIDIRVVDAEGKQVTAGEVGEIRRDCHPVAAEYARLLEPAGSDPPGNPWRLVLHRRCRLPRRGRLHLYLRPRERHDHLGRREHLPGRGRKRAVRPSSGRRCGRHRHPRRPMGRGREGDGGQKARGRRHARRINRLRPRADRSLQGATIGRFRRHAAADADRQDP